ncbi:MAG TPA: IclR family transcriptional regulator [Streptosporangiaceae bacterium]
MADDTSPVRAVTRAMDVLLSLEDGPQSLAKIADATSLTKPTAHRLLATLSRNQLVIQNPWTSDYMLGPGCLGIANAVLTGLGGLGLMAQDILDGLAKASQESVALHVPAGTQRVCVAQVPSPQPVRYTADVGAAKPMYTGAMGKILLAFAHEQDRHELFTRLTLTPVTPLTIVDRDQLEIQLAEVRKQGYAVSRGEQADGVASISAPVFAASGHVMAAVSILGPSTRMEDDTMTKLRPLVVRAGQEISRLLGYEKSPRRRRTPAASAAANGDGAE